MVLHEFKGKTFVHVLIIRSAPASKAIRDIYAPSLF